jgi:peptidoglycan/LPS O-acetylase OafA/YrhL
MGWAIFPDIGAGPVWYKASLMYENCNSQWWTQLLFINNVYPFFCAPNEGCFFWSWYILVDMQLALLTPLFVIIYIKSKAAGHVFVLFTVLITTFAALYTINLYKMRVGVLAYENWYLFAYIL